MPAGCALGAGAGSGQPTQEDFEAASYAMAVAESRTPGPSFAVHGCAPSSSSRG